MSLDMLWLSFGNVPPQKVAGNGVGWRWPVLDLTSSVSYY